MQCKKCNTRLREVTHASIGSGLNGGGYTASVVSGQTCWKCGAWVEPDMDAFVPVRPLPPAERTAETRLTPKGMTSREYSLQLRAALEPFFDRITELREKSMPMTDIVDTLKIPLAPQTCMTHYRALCIERGLGIPNMRKYSRSPE